MTNNQVRGESMYSDGSLFGTAAARVWIFVAFLINFGSLIGAVWVFFAYYVSKGIFVLLK